MAVCVCGKLGGGSFGDVTPQTTPPGTVIDLDADEQALGPVQEEEGHLCVVTKDVLKITDQSSQQ